MWCSAVLVSFGLNQSQVLRDLHLHPLLLAVVDQSAAVGVGRGARVEVVRPLALVARTVCRMSDRKYINVILIYCYFYYEYLERHMQSPVATMPDVTPPLLEACKVQVHVVLKHHCLLPFTVSRRGYCDRCNARRPRWIDSILVTSSL